MTESVEQQLVSGQTWDAFCGILKRAGQQILRPEASLEPGHIRSHYK